MQKLRIGKISILEYLYLGKFLTGMYCFGNDIILFLIRIIKKSERLGRKDIVDIKQKQKRAHTKLRRRREEESENTSEYLARKDIMNKIYILCLFFQRNRM